MTQLLDCTLYYSMVGEHFNIYDRNTDPNLVKTQALIEIFSEKNELVPIGAHAQEDWPVQEELTRINVLHEVRGGPFYTCETQCIIVNGKNQILKLGGQYRLDVKMYRSLSDPDFFSIIFKDREFSSCPTWVSL